MLVDFFRRRMKFFIWMVILVFTASVFILAAGTFWMGEQVERRRTEEEAFQKKQARTERKGELDASDATEIARVRLDGRERILTEGELNTRINLVFREQRGRLPRATTPQEIKSTLGPMFIEELVREKTYNLAADASGIDVTSERREVESNLRQAAEKAGQAVDEEQLRIQLDAIGGQMRVQRLYATVTDGAPVREDRIKEYYTLKKDEFRDPKTKGVLPLEEVRGRITGILRGMIKEDEVQEYYRRHRDRWRLPDKAKVRHLVIDPTTAHHRAQVEPTEAEIAELYKDNLKDYMGEARAHLAHIFFDPASSRYKDRAQASAAAIKEFYERTKAHHVRPERAGVRRILLKVAFDARPEEIKGTEEKAQALLRRIKSGKAFAEAASEESEDRTTAKKGGDLGMVDRNQLSPELDHVVFSLRPGEISEVVKDDEGFQIVQVHAREPERTASLDEVKEEVARKVTEEKARAQARKEAEDVASRASVPGTDFAALARQHSQAPSREKGGDLGVLFLGENRNNKLVDEVGNYSYVDAQIQEVVDKKLKVGQASGVVSSAKGFHVVKLIKKLASIPKPLAQVRQDVAFKAKQKKVDALGVELSVGLRRRLEQGEPFERLVTELSDGKDKARGGLWEGVVVAPEVRQTIGPEQLSEVTVGEALPPELVQLLRSLSPGQISDPLAIDRRQHVFQLVSRYPPEYKPLDGEIRKKIVFALNPTVTPDEEQAYFKEHKADLQPKGETTVEYFVLEDEESARDLAKELMARPNLFDRREGKERASGFIRNSQIRAAFADLKPGETLKQPYKADFGYIVGRLLARPETGEVTLEKVRDQVRARVLKQRKDELFDEWMDEVKNKVEVIRKPLTHRPAS